MTHNTDTTSDLALANSNSADVTICSAGQQALRYDADEERGAFFAAMFKSVLAGIAVLASTVQRQMFNAG
jgi:hypothetical protein